MKSINPNDKLEEVASSHAFVAETIKANLLTCCLCHRKFTGFGNNPAPVKSSGKCCDACNSNVVIPIRIKYSKNDKGGKRHDGNTRNTN